MYCNYCDNKLVDIRCDNKLVDIRCDNKLVDIRCMYVCMWT